MAATILSFSFVRNSYFSLGKSFIDVWFSDKKIIMAQGLSVKLFIYAQSGCKSIVSCGLCLILASSNVTLCTFLFEQ